MENRIHDRLNICFAGGEAIIVINLIGIAVFVVNAFKLEKIIHFIITG